MCKIVEFMPVYRKHIINTKAKQFQLPHDLVKSALDLMDQRGMQYAKHEKQLDECLGTVSTLYQAGLM